ncbi:chorismate-binding protein [Candidatus Vidania fulgoroideorum]
MIKNYNKKFFIIKRKIETEKFFKFFNISYSKIIIKNNRRKIIFICKKKRYKIKIFYFFFNFSKINFLKTNIIFVKTKRIKNIYLSGKKKKTIIRYLKIKNFLNYEKNFFYKSTKLENKYFKIFKRIKNKIKKGKLMQIQISKIKLFITNISFFKIFKIINKLNYENSIFFSVLNNIFLCFSPELLYTKKKKKLYTFPIAGTISRGENIIYDIKKEYKMLKDEKENCEHNMLIDLSRNDLNKLSNKVNIIKIKKIKKKFFLQHMISKIKCTISKKKNKMSLIIKKIHPAGTLCGTPKKKSYKYINKLEKRKYYGGCFGFKKNKKFFSYILIRTCVMKYNYLITKAASGIVENSKMLYEIKEINNKMKNFYYK